MQGGDVMDDMMSADPRDPQPNPADPKGPRTPYPVDEPVDPNGPGSEPDYFPGKPANPQPRF